MELIIDRSRWGRGNVRKSRLLVPDGGPGAGEMCCLGFYAIACGLPPSAILGTAAPRQVSILEQIGQQSDWGKLIRSRPLGLDDSDFAIEAMTINDNGELSDASREKALIELFANNGIVLQFIN